MADVDEIKRPSQWLAQVLSGQIKMENAPASIQSWARFEIYQGAREVVRMGLVEDRRAAMAKIPPSIRPYVEAEVKRIWPQRHDL